MGPDSVHSRDELGVALTELRQRAGLSVRDVASEADALLGTVAGWFAGQHAPTAASREMFESVLTVCGVPAAEHPEWWAAVTRVSRRPSRRTRPACPYRGFVEFSQSDSHLMFGRDDLLARLLDLVDSWHRGPDGPTTVMVVGASGVGKSSLVRSGLLGRIGRPLTDSDQTGPDTPGIDLSAWRGVVMVPGEDPIAALDSAIADLAGASGPAVLVVDQVEELWTQNCRERRLEFSRRIAELAVSRTVLPIGVLRADFYGQVAAVSWLTGALEHSQIVVPPMTMDQLREVIVRPAEAVGATVDDDLVDMLLEELSPGVVPPGAAAAPGVLPLLSHALRATWDRSDGRRLTVGNYLATGRIGGAVEQTAERVYQALPSTAQDLARRLILEMINVDEDSVTRRTVALADFATEEPVADDAVLPQWTPSRVLERFADARLITITDSYAQVAHEALLTAWPRLTEWIEADQERLLLARRLRTLCEHWEDNGRRDDLLPGGPTLAMFATLADAGSVSLDQRSREFLEAGQARHEAATEAERNRARQLRRVAVSAGVFGVVAVLAAITAVLAGVNAVQQRQQAEEVRNEALSRQLAVQSSEMSRRDPALAAQLAMVAYRQAPTLQARSRLIEAAGDPVPTRFIARPGPVRLATDDRGKILAAVSRSGYVRVFGLGPDGVTGQTSTFEVTRRGEGALGAVTFVPGTSTLLVGGRNSVSAWRLDNPAAPTRIGELPGVRGQVESLAVSRDGRLVVAGVGGVGAVVWTRPAALPATTPADSSAVPWGPGSWTQIAMPADAAAGEGGAVAVSPSGALVATSTAFRRIELWRNLGDRLARAGEVHLAAGADNQRAEDLTFGPDDRTLFAGLRSRTVDVFDVGDPAAPRRTGQHGGFNDYISTLAVSADGTQLAAGGADNSVRIIDLRDPAAPARSLPVPANVTSVLFAGSHVIMAGADGIVVDWPPSRSVVTIGTGAVYQIPADRLGTRILASDTTIDGRVTQWAVSSGTMRRAGPDLLPPPDEVFSGAAVLSGTGRIAVMGTVSGAVVFADYTDPAAPRILSRVPAQSSLNETVDYSERSGIAVTGATDLGKATVLDASDPSNPRVVGEFDAGDGAWWVSLSPDGRRVAVATVSGAVLVYDLSTPSTPRLLGVVHRFETAALSVRFDASGTRLIAASENKRVAVVDVTDPRHPHTVAEMSGPTSELYSAAFSSDGRRVVAGGSNAEVWVWDIGDNGPKRVAVLRSFPGRVYDVRLTPDGRLYASGEGGVLRSWEIDAARVMDELCARPGDQITKAEWRNYLPDVPYDPPCPR